MAVDLSDSEYGEEPEFAKDHNKPPATFEDELRLENPELFLKLDALKLSRAKLPAVVDDDAGLERIGGFILEARALTKATERAHVAAKAPHKLKADTCDKVFLTKGVAGEIKKLTDVVQAIADDYTERKAVKARAAARAAADAARVASESSAYEAQALRDGGAHSVAEVAESQSEHAERAADKLDAKALGTVSNLVRTRMDGMTASGREVWTFEIEDSAKLDFNALGPSILDHELRQIIQRYVDTGGRELAGVRIYPKNVSTFR